MPCRELKLPHEQCIEVKAIVAQRTALYRH